MSSFTLQHCSKPTVSSSTEATHCDSLPSRSCPPPVVTVFTADRHIHQQKCSYNSGLSNIKKTLVHLSELMFPNDPNCLCLPFLSQTLFTMLPVFIIQMFFSNSFFPVDDFRVHTETRALQMSEQLSSSLHRSLLFNKAFSLTYVF